MELMKEVNGFSLLVRSQNSALAEFCWGIASKVVTTDFGRYTYTTTKLMVSLDLEMTPAGISPPVTVKLTGPKDDVTAVIRSLVDAGLVVVARKFSSKTDYGRRRHAIVPPSSGRDGVFGECRVRGIDIDQVLLREALREIEEDW